MGFYRGGWYVIPLELDRHPAVVRLRVDAKDPNADIWLLRSYGFAKSYALHGCMEPLEGEGRGNNWPGLAGFIWWPNSWESLRELFIRSGVVVGQGRCLLLWDEANGQAIRAQREDAERKKLERRKKRAAEMAEIRRLAAKAKKKGQKAQ